MRVAYELKRYEYELAIAPPAVVTWTHDIAASAQRFPFLLSEEEMTDLGAPRVQAYLDSAGRVREWAQCFVAGPGPGGGTDTLSLLVDTSAGGAVQIAYETREDDGAQSPGETLVRRSAAVRASVLCVSQTAC